MDVDVDGHGDGDLDVAGPSSTRTASERRLSTWGVQLHVAVAVAVNDYVDAHVENWGLIF